MRYTFATFPRLSLSRNGSGDWQDGIAPSRQKQACTWYRRYRPWTFRFLARNNSGQVPGADSKGEDIGVTLSEGNALARLFEADGERVMRCRLCDHANRASALHCGACGQYLLTTCPVCANDNSPDSGFCDSCGSQLVGAIAEKRAKVDATLATPPAEHELINSATAVRASAHLAPRQYTPPHLTEKILQSRFALEGERKQVTVMFCDMANSTELAHRLGAEAMHKLLNQFFALALTEVHRLEGTVNQFLGDGFMALFGAPVAHEDHVRRALLAALGIRERLKKVEESADSALSAVSVRMGVNTGMVVVGTIGDNLRMDYTAIGDTTNIAARLQQFAQPGQICVGETVHAAGQSFFDFSPLAKQNLKGVAEAVSVYCVTKAHREHAASRTVRLGIGSPLVGRDRELSTIEDALIHLGAGEGGILILTGEPGAGKSRLVTEVRRQPTDVPLRWLEGRALSFGRSLSYLPFIEILKSCFNIGEDDTEVETWQKLESSLVALFAERTSEMLPYLATVLALRLPSELEDKVKYLDGQALRRQVFLCMRQFFERLTQRQPVVLLLEDWHWADQSSIELAEHLLTLAASSRMLAFFATRPEPDGPSQSIRQCVARQPGLSLREISLLPLSDRQSEIMIANIVGGVALPAALREQLLRKTEGNPFFIEEVIRTLISEGVLVHGARDDDWHALKRIDEVLLPDTVQGVILARIDRLDEGGKEALKLASVIGRSFFNRVLEAISATRRDLKSSVAELEHAELIRERQGLPEIEYVFKHALVHEAAYGSILVENRRVIHGQVAQAIEMLFEGRLDEFTSLLAHHYTRAEDWEKAQSYLFKAGDQAGRMAADTEALEHFRLAEAAYQKAFGDRLSPLQRASLARKVGSALYGTGNYMAALEQFRRALSQLGRPYPTSRWGVRRVIVKHLWAHMLRHLRSRLRLPVPRSMDLVTAQEIATICHSMAWMDYFLDKERMFLDCLIELSAGEQSAYIVAEARGLSSLGFGFMIFDLRRLARWYHERAGVIAHQTAHPSAMAFSAFSLGFLDFYDGRWDTCEANLDKGGTIYRQAGDIHRWGGAMIIRGLVVAFRGDLAQLAVIATDLVSAGQDAADPQLTSWGLQVRGHRGLAVGPLDAVVADLRAGVALAESIPAWNNFLYQQSLLGKCLVLQGKLDEAMVGLRTALRIMETAQLSRPFDQVELLTAVTACSLALAERQTGPERPRALRLARRAAHRALLSARIQPGWLPQALRHQGTLEWLCGKPVAAQRHWRESAILAERYEFKIEHAQTLLEMGQRTGVLGMVEQASDMFRHTGATCYRALALHALAQLHGQSSGDPAIIARHAANAITALAEVHAYGALEVAQRAYPSAPAVPQHAPTDIH